MKWKAECYLFVYVSCKNRKLGRNLLWILIGSSRWDFTLHPPHHEAHWWSWFWRTVPQVSLLYPTGSLRSIQRDCYWAQPSSLMEASLTTGNTVERWFSCPAWLLAPWGWVSLKPEPPLLVLKNSPTVLPQMLRKLCAEVSPYFIYIYLILSFTWPSIL